MAKRKKKKLPPKKTRRRPPSKPPKKKLRSAPRKRPSKKPKKQLRPTPRKRAPKKPKPTPRPRPSKKPKKLHRPAPRRVLKKRPKKPPAPPRPQRWYVETGRAQAEARALERLPAPTDQEAREALRAELIAQARADEKLYLRESVKKLRRMFDGFDVEHGYDLRHPELWTRAQVTKVKEFYGTVAQVFSQPHVTLITPRSRRSRIALESFTGQRYKNQRAFAVALPSADSTVSVRDGVVEVLRKVKRGKLVDQFFLFEEIFGIRPEGWRDIIEMTQIMVGTTRKERTAKYKKSYLFDPDQEVILRDMPEGFYTIWSEVNGDIGIPVRKQFLVRQMREWFEAYGQEASATYHEGFDEVILGFHYQSTIRTDSDALRRKAELDSDRRTKQAERRKEWRARRRRVRR